MNLYIIGFLEAQHNTFLWYFFFWGPSTIDFYVFVEVKFNWFVNKQTIITKSKSLRSQCFANYDTFYISIQVNWRFWLQLLAQRKINQTTFIVSRASLFHFFFCLLSHRRISKKSKMNQRRLQVKGAVCFSFYIILMVSTVDSSSSLFVCRWTN